MDNERVGVARVLRVRDRRSIARSRALDLPLRSPAELAATDTQALTQDDYRALGEFRHAIRQFLAFSEEGAKAHGLTSQQHQALLVVRAHAGPGPISISDLAQSLLIKNHSAVELVARLVERDLVSRREADLDRRRVVLSLRPRGAEILEAISRRNLARLNDGADILVEIVEAARRAARPPR
ncbi:MAG: MarR family transcriptional regulator [Caulobacter sp.]|nr:MarR family transcriptional regulator [Caulobacter sp.]